MNPASPVLDIAHRTQNEEYVDCSPDLLIGSTTQDNYRNLFPIAN